MVLVGPDYSDILQKPDVYVSRFGDWTTDLLTTEEGQSHGSALAVEALAVGVSTALAYWILHKAVNRLAMNQTDMTKDLITAGVAGGLLHIVAEETGINNWFLTNSVASKKAGVANLVIQQGVTGSIITTLNTSRLNKMSSPMDAKHKQAFDIENGCLSGSCRRK